MPPAQSIQMPKDQSDWQEIILTLGRTRKFIPPSWYEAEGGGGGWMEPNLQF